MSDHPETDAHVASLKKTPSCFCETTFAEKMERNRNRWRSVAEQAEKGLRWAYKRVRPDHDRGCSPMECKCGLKDCKEALAAFDSLRKEDG